MDQRTDLLTAALIDGVVNDLPRKGMSHSARALYDAGATVELAIRVLTQPFERRATSNNR
jgi:hypothetical protein